MLKVSFHNYFIQLSENAYRLLVKFTLLNFIMYGALILRIDSEEMLYIYSE